jgi:type I restriction enzyme, S subunit
MRGNWPTKKIKDVAPAVPAEFPSAEDIVWNLSLEDIESGTGRILREVKTKVADLGSSKTAFDTRHVLYSKLRPYLNKVVVPQCSGVGTSELIPLCPNPNLLDRDFLAFFLRSADFLNFANKNTQGANLPRLSMREFWQFTAPIPPLDEQCRIVDRIKDCLSRVDEIKRLREESQQEVNALQVASLNEIEKGLSCPTAKIGDIIEDSQNGRSIRSDEINYNGYVLTLSAVRTLELDVEQRKPVQLTDSIAEKYGVKTGDVFISRANTIELVGLASILTSAAPERTIYPDLMIRLTPVLAKIQPKYLALALRFPSVRRQIQYHAKGSSQSMVKISGASLREVSIPLPCLNEQEVIIAKTNEARNATALLRAEIDQKEVDGLTQAILRKAFAGEL